MEKIVTLANYCERCQKEHNLPQCANFLFHNICEVCGLPASIVFFSGGCCIVDR